MPHQIRVLLAFSTAPDHKIEDTAVAVIKGLTGNTAYPTPPVTLANLQSALTAFTTAMANQVQGGTLATADKNNKRDLLINQLRLLAAYVQQNCNNDLARLLSSGFEAVSANRTRTALETPNIVSIENANAGQLRVKVTPVANARCYEVRYAILAPNGNQGEAHNGGLFTNSRSMAVSNLTAGTNYNIQVRAIGGTTGYSDWSDPVSHMSL